MWRIMTAPSRVDFRRTALYERVQALLTRAAARREMRRERAQLLALTDRELRDIGISRIDALREARRRR